MMTNNESYMGVQAKMLEAVAAFTEANRRVAGELIELSAQAAREGLRTVGELQSAALETAQAMPGDLRQDPFAFCRKGFEVTGKLVETQAQIIARNAERLQASTERAAREIEQATSGYLSQLKDLYTR
jgi:hypothetical protein